MQTVQPYGSSTAPMAPAHPDDIWTICGVSGQ